MSQKSSLCSYCNIVEKIVIYVTVLKEDQGFEPWNATNVNSFQDYRHQPLGQSSRKVLNGLQNPNASLYVGVLLLARQCPRLRKH